MSLQNWWYKKERPFMGLMGFGGGATAVTAGGAVMTPEEYWYGPGQSGAIAIPPACSTIRVAGVAAGAQGYGDPSNHTEGYPAGGGGAGNIVGYEITANPYRGTNISFGTPGPVYIQHPTGTLWNAGAGQAGPQSGGQPGGEGGAMATGPGTQGGDGGQGGPREQPGGTGGGGATGCGGGGGGGHGDGSGNPGKPGGDGGTGSVTNAITPITTNQVQGNGPGSSFTLVAVTGGEGGGPNQNGQPAGGTAGTKGNHWANGGGGGGGGGISVYGGNGYGAGGGGGGACWDNGSSQGGQGSGGFIIVQLE